MPETPVSKEREFKATSAVAIFGAPISWVALFGALIGALAVIPFIFYSQGGGFTSLGMGLFAPMAGVMLGPWAGFVAGFIGGFIGMMISPGAYPLGFVDVFLSGAMLPLSWGLMQPKYRKLLLVYFPVNAFLMWFFPYHWPAQAIGVNPAVEPQWILTVNWVWISLIVFLVGAPTIWRWFESENRTKSIVGLTLNMFLADALWAMPWIYPYYALIKYPYEAAILGVVTSWVNNLIPMTVTTTVVGYFLIRAVRKGNLRVVPNSWLAGFSFKGPA
jgi:hypothetical protein